MGCAGEERDEKEHPKGVYTHCGYTEVIRNYEQKAKREVKNISSKIFKFIEKPKELK